MELQLGLALSSSSSSSCLEWSAETNKGFDLLSNGVKEELFGSVDVPDDHFKKRKRFADQHYSGFHLPQTLPLLVWNKFDNNNKNHSQQQQETDDGNEVQSNSIFVHHKNDEEKGVIGWPPVKSCRKKVVWQVKNGRWKSMYVKAQMEGVGIARKVDLNLHTSYQTLVVTLVNMFGKSPEEVKLTYQDKEGDWLLAGDVPWRSFVETVQRLKLLRQRNNCG